MIRRMSVGTFAVAILAIGSARLNAAEIAGSMYESFDYAAGTEFPNDSTLNSGTGWNAGGSAGPNAAVSNWGSANNGGAAAQRTATSPGLTYTATGYAPASSGKLTLDAVATNTNQHVGRNFGGQTIDSGTTYFSLLMSKNTPETMRTINFAFFNGTSERFAVGQIATGSGNSAGNLALLMNNQNPAGLIQAAPGTEIAMGTDVPHLLIGKIEWNAAGNETVSLWVDELDVTSEAAVGAPYVSTSGFELTALTGVRPFVGNTSGSFAAVSANFDEFRIGGTWESVTAMNAAIPEPGSMVLLSLAGLALGACRKRR